MNNEAILKRVLDAVAKAGLSPAAASKLVDGKPDLIRNWQRDSRILPRLDTLTALAQVLGVTPAWLAFADGNDLRGISDQNNQARLASKFLRSVAIPLVGTVSGGVWREVDNLDQDEKPASPFLPDPRWPADKQFALKIEGESINRVARDGDIIAVVDIHALQTQVADDALVVVEESRDGALIRTTAKRLRRRGKLTELHADSDDPRWRDVRLIIEPDTDDARLITTRIVGLVTAVHKALA